MSVTNPERVVTKQDLADFYAEILPYLGGSGGGSSAIPEYETLPTPTSEWSGKYIRYVGADSGELQKNTVMRCRIDPNGDLDWFPAASELCDGYFKWDEDVTYSIIVDSTTNPKQKARIRITKDTTPTSGSSNVITSGAVYTALSGKQDYDVYSTSEKAVGKWINNATIYRRTYTGTLSSSTGNTTISSSFSYTPIKYEGIVYTSVLNVPITATAGGGSSSVSIACFKQNSSIIIANSNASINGATYYLTIYYLK